MAKFINEESTQGEGFEPIPDDTVAEAELIGLKLKTKRDKQGQPWLDKETQKPIRRVEFAFKIVEGDHENRRVWGDTSTLMNMHPNCKLRSWVQELLGSDIPPGFELDIPDVDEGETYTSDLVGNRCRVHIGWETWKDKITDEDKGKNVVRDVLRSRAAMSGSATGRTDPDPF